MPNTVYIADQTTNIKQVDTSQFYNVLATVGPAMAGTDQLRLTGMAWDATTSTLFGVTGSADPNWPAWFVSIDPTDATCTLIGALGAGKNCGDITVDASGNVYGWKAGSNSRLISINKSTGAGSFVGSATSIWGGTIQVISGVAYVMPQDNVLYTCDLSTGVLTSVASLSGPGSFFNSSFEYGGNLYGTDTSQCYLVNKTTGATSYTGPGAIGGGNVDGSVSIPYPPALSPPAVPPNNDFANATELTQTSGSIAGTLASATPDWPTGSSETGDNVWYKITPPVTGEYTFWSPQTSDVYIYSGTWPGSMTQLTTVGGDPTTLTEGTEYYISVAYNTLAFTLYWVGPYAPTTRTEWRIGLYNANAEGLYSSTYEDDDIQTEFLAHPSDCRLTYTLNGIDQLEFSLLLDDPAAMNINKKTTFVRLWRYINDEENEKYRNPPVGTPDFCGVVTGIRKSGSQNKMYVTVMSVLWLVQTHFHIQNHRLVNDFSPVPVYNTGGNLNNKKWDASALMWRLIDLINGAFSGSFNEWGQYISDTGIRKPPTADYTGSGYLAGDDLFWPQTIQVSPFYVMKAAYTWPLIYDDLLSRDGSPDLAPEYIYEPVAATKFKKMYFKTEVVRGTDRTATVSFDYRTGEKNIEDIEESSQVVPGEYANYIAVSGDGGPNGNLYTVADDDADITDNGLFMKSENIPGTKLADVQQVANALIKSAAQADAPIYSVTMSPAAPLYYDLDYFLGDLISLNADRGALQVEDVAQRIYQVTLSWSDNNVESAEVMISKDFKRKFV